MTTDQAQVARTILMVLDSVALAAGVDMHCERLALQRVELAKRIAAQLRSEGLVA